MYKSYLLEVSEVGEALQEIDEQGLKLAGITYVTDGQQVLLIAEGKESGHDMRLDDET